MVFSGTRLEIGPLQALFFAFCAILAFSPTASAGHCRVGRQENLRHIQDVDLKDAEGEPLYLGYKFTHYMACLPYSISDDGYILGVRGKDRYIPLDDARREALQAQGLLPTPLPAYQISAVDKVFGYSAWALAAFIPFGVGLSVLRRRRLARALPDFNSGLSHLSRREFDKAVTAFNAAAAIAPKAVPILLNRAHAFAGMQDHARAISDYTKVMTIEPKNVRAVLSRASAFRAVGNLGGALADCTRALKLSRSELTYCSRGAVRAQIQDFKGASKTSRARSSSIRCP